MQADFWHDRWERNQIGFHLEQVNPHFARYWPDLGLEPGARVLVPLNTRFPGCFGRAAIPSVNGTRRPTNITDGELPERTNGTVSKTVECASIPRVRIPYSPPLHP